MQGDETTRRGLAAAGLGSLGVLLASTKAKGGRMLPVAAAALGPRKAAADLTLDVREFGARGDGEVDDAPALNAAIRELRQRHLRAARSVIGARLIFPTGVYVAESSIDLTDIRNINTVIDGAGSVILGRCAGRPVIDALGSRWLTLRDLTIMGDGDAVPNIGLQIGLGSAGVVADSHRMDDVKILGHFLLACLYNRAAETCEFDHLLLWNDQPGSFCLVQDGMNHFAVGSAFTSTNVEADVDLSFNENIFISCDFRHGAGGTPVWLGDTARHAFVRCYSATRQGPSFILHCGGNSHTMLDVDCHCETEGLEDVFRVTASRDNATIRGLSYRDHTSFASRSVLSAAPHMRQIRIDDAKLNVTSYQVRDCRLFDDPLRWTVNGHYTTSVQDTWNGGPTFNGYVSLDGHLAQCGNVGTKADTGFLSDRPRLATGIDEGRLYFDKSIGKLLIWSGSGWVDANGSAV